jgi:hypothetical protein
MTLGALLPDEMLLVNLAVVLLCWRAGQPLKPKQLLPAALLGL